MTSPLRRKRPTIALAPTTPPRTERSAWGRHMLALLAAGLFASLADAQTNPPPTAKMRVYTRDSLGISPPEPLEEVQLGPGPIEKIAAQGRPQKPEDEIADFQLRLEPPDPERLFLRDSERGFQDRVRQEARNRLGAVRVIFPEDSPLTKEAWTPRQFPPRTELV